MGGERVLLLVETTVLWFSGMRCELIPHGEQVEDRMYRTIGDFWLEDDVFKHFRKVTLEVV